MSNGQSQPLDLLIEQATKTAQRMVETATGRTPETKVDMPISSFSGIATILSQLADQAGEAKDQQSRQAAALTRIANLQIRGAEELLELAAWKKIAGELQTIAQEALGMPRSKTQGRPAASR